MKKGQRQTRPKDDKTALLLSSLPLYSFVLIALACACVFVLVPSPFPFFPSPFEGNSYCNLLHCRKEASAVLSFFDGKQKHLYCVKHSELTLAY